MEGRRVGGKGPESALKKLWFWYPFLSFRCSLVLWSGRAPNSTETQKELKWPKRDSKWLPKSQSRVTPSDSKWLKNDPKMGSGVTFESILGHFGVGLPESLLSHFWVTLILYGSHHPKPPWPKFCRSEHSWEWHMWIQRDFKGLFSRGTQTGL